MKNKLASHTMYTLTKGASLLGLAAAGIHAGIIGYAAFMTGGASFALGSALSATALAAVSWAGYKSASSADSMENGYLTSTVTPLTSSIARLGGIIFALGGVALMATGLAGPLVVPALVGEGLLFAAVGYGVFESGQQSVAARQYAIKHKREFIEPKKAVHRAHAPAHAPVVSHTKARSTSADLSDHELGEVAELEDASHRPARKEKLVVGEYTQKLAEADTLSSSDHHVSR